MKLVQFFRTAGIFTVLTLGLQFTAIAHVKWFTNYSYMHEPLRLGEIFSTTFWAFLLFSLSAISLLVFLDDKITHLSGYSRFNTLLSRYAVKSDLIIRVATGAVLLLSWQSGALLVPELVLDSAWIDLVQLVMAILILSNRLTNYAGISLCLLYLFAMAKFGALHMLDYTYLVGAGYYLAVSGSVHKKKRATALPALYASVGFSLSWVAFEKIVYPAWGLQILASNPHLTLGIDPNMFLLVAAFTEFSLGFLLIVCLLQRPIALAITLLFISTTLVFGKLEFIGHAIVHAALIVFIVQGAGTTFRTPITFFKRIGQRIAFSVLSFTAIFLVMLATYTDAAQGAYQIAQAEAKADPHAMLTSVSTSTAPPSVSLDIQEDDHSGWNIQLQTSNFTFSPENCGKQHVDGHGHAHLYINDQKVARLYGAWFHVDTLPPGKHVIKVTLTANDHSLYAIDDIPISATASLVVL